MDDLFSFPAALVMIVILIFAGVAHGAIGFGFPVVATPLVAMMTDVKTAILATLAPNLAINIISVLRGGNWRMSLAKHWPVALYVLVGTVIGSHVLFTVDPEPLKLFLAFMLVLYLLQNKIRGIDWMSIRRHRQRSAVCFGLAGGFLSGTVNVTVPPLVLYFSALGLEAVPMRQILNLCFLVGKSTQAVTFISTGKFGLATLAQTLHLILISCAALMLGIHLHHKIRPEAYQAILRKILWAMALVLIGQVAWHYLD